MANSTKPLTNTEVKQAKPKDSEYNLSDGKGLFLRVKPNNTNLWLFNYFKPFTEKRSNISLGQYPAIFLAKARSLRDEYRDLLANDVDPKDHRKYLDSANQEAYSNTFEVVYQRWLATKEGQWSDSYRERLTSAMGFTSCLS